LDEGILCVPLVSSQMLYIVAMANFVTMLRSNKISQILYWTGWLLLFVVLQFGGKLSAIFTGVVFLIFSMIAAFFEYRKAGILDKGKLLKYCSLCILSILLFVLLGLIMT